MKVKDYTHSSVMVTDLFTYDMVTDPGFSDSKLEMPYELWIKLRNNERKRLISNILDKIKKPLD